MKTEIKLDTQANSSLYRICIEIEIEESKLERMSSCERDCVNEATVRK